MTIAQIQAQIIAQKDSYPSLAALNATGDGVIWWTWTWVVATVIWLQYSLLEVLRSDVESAGKSIQYGTAQWYVAISKEFQFGYTLIWNDLTKRYVYPNSDLVARVIAYASLTETASGINLLKVARNDSGVPSPLTSAQLLAFQSYIHTQKIPGTFINVISENPDLAKIALTVHYDPQTPISTLQPLVEEAINNYLTSLPFNAKFRVLHLIDALQRVTGVVDLSGVSVEARWGLNTYSIVVNEYTAYAGYMRIDSSAPLSATITYLPTI